MLFGLMSGVSFREPSVCPFGFSALQVLLWWLPVCLKWVIGCFIRIDAAEYQSVNSTLSQESIANSAPRYTQAAFSRVSHCALVSVSGGALSALSLTLSPRWQGGDLHVLTLVLLLLCRSRAGCTAASMLAAYAWVSRPLPFAHGIVRSCVTVLAVALYSVFLPLGWSLVRLATSILVAFLTSSTCSSKAGALSPAIVLWCATHQCGMSMTVVLAFAICVLLV